MIFHSLITLSMKIQQLPMWFERYMFNTFISLTLLMRIIFSEKRQSAGFKLEDYQNEKLMRLELPAISEESGVDKRKKSWAIPRRH